MARGLQHVAPRKASATMKTLCHALLIATLGTLTGCAVDPDAREDEAVDSAAAAYTVTPTSTTTLPVRGGTGGDATVLRCNSGDVVVGIAGRRGNVVDQVALLCANLRSNGTTGTRYVTQSLGGNGGTFYTSACGEGGVVTGFEGYAATYVDQLVVRCTFPPFDRYGGLTSGYQIPPGGRFFRDDCPPRYGVTAVSIRHGTVVDAERALCTYLGTP